MKHMIWIYRKYILHSSYVTRRVIAMGFPSVGCESMWRNSLADTKGYLKHHHKEVKVNYILILDI